LPTITDLTCKRHYHLQIDVQLAAVAADADAAADGHQGPDYSSGSSIVAANLFATLDDCKPSFPFIFTF